MSQKYGYLANQEINREQGVSPCLVCDDKDPHYSWTDYSGEAYCTRCGTAYQLKWGDLKEGESYPRINIEAEWIPVLRDYYAETHQLNGSGTYLSFCYPEQAKGNEQFNEWFDANKEKYPELLKESS